MSRREAVMLAVVVTSAALSLTSDVIDEGETLEFQAEIVRELVISATELEEPELRDEDDAPAVTALM